MAQYGPPQVPGNGTIPFTGWTPTLGSGAANQGATSGIVWDNGFNQQDARIAHYLRVPGARGLRRLLLALVGAAPGATAQEFRTRLKAQISAPGGAQLMEQIAYVNRVTTAQDVSWINNGLLARTPGPSPYPADIGGNGGGGKLHFMGIG